MTTPHSATDKSDGKGTTASTVASGGKTTVGRAKPVRYPRTLHGWEELSKYALNLHADGEVRIDYPQLFKWVVRTGKNRKFRARQVVMVEDRQPSCTCGEWANGYACWHVAYVCHFYGIQVPT